MQNKKRKQRTKYKANPRPAANVAPSRRSGRRGKDGGLPAVPSAVSAEVIEKMRGIGRDGVFCDYISKNIGRQANDIIGSLICGSKPDEQIAEELNLKLNETRRMLNMLNNYGIVRYDVNRDSTGWLTFEWRIDGGSFLEFSKAVSEKASIKKPTLPEDCNDFFVCSVCYDKQKIIYPFDVAYECGFRCECGKSLGMLTRGEAEIAAKA